MSLSEQLITLLESEDYQVRCILENVRGAGYWISPGGASFPVSQNHILTVIEAPEKFNMTREAIEAVYARHKEPFGSEGNAREELILDLVKRGWVRIRNYHGKRTGEYWSVNVNRLTTRVKDQITSLFQRIFPSGGYDAVYIDSPSERVQFTIDDIVKFKLFSEAKEVKDLEPLTFYTGVKAFPG